LFDRLRNYALSHMTAFSSWWDSPARLDEELGWGRNSFFGPLALLNPDPRQPGVYDVIMSERYQIDTNICTLYRGLISDFSLPGAWLLVGGIAYGAGRCYRRILRTRHSAGATVFLCAYLSLLAWSHIINLFGYTTVLLSFFIYSVACMFLDHRSQPAAYPQPRST
jgi:hypothetical protein